MAINVIVRYLLDEHEINAYMADCPSVCLSVRMIQVEKSWTDFIEISYGCYAL
jgi:hypothetical protein